MSRSPRIPQYLTCARPGCGIVKALRRPSDAKVRRFCSRRCAQLVLENWRHAREKGVLASVKARRQHVLQSLEGLTVLQAFRKGYDLGLQSKHRQIRKWRKRQRERAA